MIIGREYEYRNRQVVHIGYLSQSHRVKGVAGPKSNPSEARSVITDGDIEPKERKPSRTDVVQGNPNERSKPNAAMYQDIVADQADVNKGYLAKGTNEWKD
jgi:hypothetical protein